MKTSSYENSHPPGAKLLLALDGELLPDEAASIARHVERCPVCYAQWEQWRRIAERILDYHNGTLQARVPPMRLPLPHVEAGSRRARAKARVLAAISGAAAALVCLAWLFARADRPAQMPQRATAAAPVVAALPPALPQQQAVRHRRPQPRRVAARASDNPSFLALPFSDDALPIRDATVVRVQLPVEELRLTGLVVEGAEAAATVQADVLLGIDGLPRGIRLVQ